MNMSGSSPNDSPKPVISSPWSQIVAAAAVPSSSRSPPPVVAESSVVNSTQAEDSDKAAVGHNVNSGKRPVWNKLSNAASSSVMGADSWPALTDSARTPARSPSELQLQGAANMFPTPQRTVRNTASMNDMIMTSQIHPRPYRHSNGGHPSQLPPPQGPMVAPVSHNYNKGHQSRPGFMANDHPQQRNSSRNRNAIPHQRGDGAHHHTGPHQRGDCAHHHNYGNKRDQDRSNQDWTTHQFGRENYMTPRFAAQYMPPPPLFAQPPPPQFLGPIGYREVPLQMVYSPPPLESLRSIPFVPPLPPSAMSVQPMEQSSSLESLHIKILKQIDYYFSIENLIRDDYLRGHMDDQGWVSIYFVASFPKVQHMTQDIQTVLDAVQSSRVVEVQGEKIRKRDDWRRWIIQKDLLSMYSSRSRDFEDLNSRYLLSTSDGTGQVGIQISGHSISARN